MKKEDKIESEKKVVAEGEVKEILPGLKYLVEVDFKGIKHKVICYVSGKMRTHYIQLALGDLVRVEIPLSDIDKGRIVYRITNKNPRSAPPRRPKK
ncbi:MAG: translation initiation factor IF-1 [Candidatus Dojkabacteria bacterium]|nr:translation initiation factor IF-1 [Candidatus Dojkabacteria bacterium]MDQ7021842.1 translation initiation factor IF-1 [Candidatus Dojkabacteria bacterium]